MTKKAPRMRAFWSVLERTRCQLRRRRIANASPSKPKPRSDDATTKAGESAELLNRTVLTIAHQAGEDGRLFGSVTSQDIADAIKEARGITIDRRDIRLDEPIKTVGTRMVEVEVQAGVVATVKTMVTEQK